MAKKKRFPEPDRLRILKKLRIDEELLAADKKIKSSPSPGQRWISALVEKDPIQASPSRGRRPLAPHCPTPRSLRHTTRHATTAAVLPQNDETFARAPRPRIF